MSGFIPIEMYLALAEELKAYKDKNQFLEKEIKDLRSKNQELRVDLVNTEEQMELIYSQSKMLADQNQFLKSEMEKTQPGPILPSPLTPSPTSSSLETELPVLEELPDSFPLEYENVEDNREDENLENSTTGKEVVAIEAPVCDPIFEPVSSEPIFEAPMCNPIFEPVSEEPLNETIWCGPEPGSVKILVEDEQEEYILQEVPTKLPSLIPQTKKASIAEKKKTGKRPKVIKALSVPAKKMRLEKEEKSAPFYCRILPCDTTALQSLDDHHKHLKLNHPNKPFLCSRCPYATDSKWGLKNHEKTHEKNDLAYQETQQGAICELCNIVFASSKRGLGTAGLGRHANLFH